MEFKSSYLLHQADNNNVFAIVNSSFPSNDKLKYQSETDRYSPDSTNYNSMGYRSIKIGKQVVLSQISGVILASGFVIAGALIAPGALSFAPYIMYGGYITGMATGVHYFGNDKYEQAGFSKSLIGALIGLPIGILIYNSDPKPHGFTAIAPFLFPTLGAVISFNISAKPK